MKILISTILIGLISLSTWANNLGFRGAWFDSTASTKSQLGVEGFMVFDKEFSPWSLEFVGGGTGIETNGGADLDMTYLYFTVLHNWAVTPGCDMYLGAGGGYAFFDLTLPREFTDFYEAFGITVKATMDDTFTYHVKTGFTTTINPRTNLNLDIRYQWIDLDAQGSVSVPFFGTIGTVDQSGDMHGLVASLGVSFKI